jgi:hypothetical protein
MDFIDIDFSICNFHLLVNFLFEKLYQQVFSSIPTYFYCIFSHPNRNRTSKHGSAGRDCSTTGGKKYYARFRNNLTETLQTSSAEATRNS